MSEPLKLCPMCAAKALAEAEQDWHWCQCSNCGTRTGFASTERAAVAAWNRRAPAALPTREEVAEAIWRAWSPQCDRCDVLRGCGCSEAAADAVLALMGRTA